MRVCVRACATVRVFVRECACVRYCMDACVHCRVGIIRYMYTCIRVSYVFQRLLRELFICDIVFLYIIAI